MKFYKTPVVLLFLLFIAFSPLGAIVIKIGSIAPSRSPWDKALNQIAVEWEKITNGEVQLKIYPGGITGGELDMQRKIRVGTLGGGVFSNMGISKIEHEIFSLNTPFLFNSNEEFNYVFEKLLPTFEKKLEERGFKVIIWTQAGWIHIFSKDKVIYPDDLKKEKISFTTGEPEMEQAWKKSGFQVIPQELNDMMMALQSGMVTAFYLPPLLAGSGQYFALAPNMLNIKLSPLVGGLLISKRIWDRIPAKYHQPMLDAVKEAMQNLFQTTDTLEKDTIETMKKHGLIINNPPADALEKWRAAAAKGMDELVGKAFSKEIFDLTNSYVEEYRKKREQ